MPYDENEDQYLEAKPNVNVAVQERNEVKPQRPHIVIIWNDNEHSAEFVFEVLMKVCSMTKDEAIKTTMEIHTQGRGIAWRGMKEHAEFKRDQIATFRDEAAQELAGAPNLPLNVTIESE